MKSTDLKSSVPINKIYIKNQNIEDSSHKSVVTKRIVLQRFLRSFTIPIRYNTEGIANYSSSTPRDTIGLTDKQMSTLSKIPL